MVMVGEIGFPLDSYNKNSYSTELPASSNVSAKDVIKKGRVLNRCKSNWHVNNESQPEIGKFWQKYIPNRILKVEM